MKRPGAILLISCYELGHQPIGLASPLGFFERAGFASDVMDIAVENLDLKKAARADFVGICVPMHTALRLGVHVASRVREINLTCHICFLRSLRLAERRIPTRTPRRFGHRG